MARGAPVAALAHHVEQSACPGDDEAIGRLTAAGDDASSRAPAVAARWYGAALRVVPGGAGSDARRLELLVPLARSLGSAGLLEESHRALSRLSSSPLPAHPSWGPGWSPSAPRSSISSGPTAMPTADSSTPSPNWATNARWRRPR